jgi:hypothetical protein
MLQRRGGIARQIGAGSVPETLTRGAQINPVEAAIGGLDFERRAASVALDRAFVIFRVDFIKVDVMSA